MNMDSCLPGINSGWECLLSQVFIRSWKYNSKCVCMCVCACTLCVLRVLCVCVCGWIDFSKSVIMVCSVVMYTLNYFTIVLLVAIVLLPTSATLLSVVVFSCLSHFRVLVVYIRSENSEAAPSPPISVQTVQVAFQTVSFYCAIYIAGYSMRFLREYFLWFTWLRQIHPEFFTATPHDMHFEKNMKILSQNVINRKIHKNFSLNQFVLCCIWETCMHFCCRLWPSNSWTLTQAI